MVLSVARVVFVAVVIEKSGRGGSGGDGWNEYLACVARVRASRSCRVASAGSINVARSGLVWELRPWLNLRKRARLM